MASVSYSENDEQISISVTAGPGEARVALFVFLSKYYGDELRALFAQQDVHGIDDSTVRTFKWDDPQPLDVTTVVDKDGDTWVRVYGGPWRMQDDSDMSPREWGHLVKQFGPVRVP